MKILINLHRAQKIL